MSGEAAGATESRQRAEAYWFLASLFGGPIDREILERIVGVAADRVPEEAGIARELRAVLVSEPDVGALAERLATDHARLFLGLRQGYGPPPPYESLWREGRIQGDTTLGVAGAYSAAGFEDRGPWGPCDHIAYELRFLASLCNAESEAVAAGRSEEGDWARERQAEFLAEHLLAWVPAYCRRLAGQAGEPLYAALARVTTDVLAADARRLGAGTTSVDGARTPRSGDWQPEGVKA